MVPAILLLFTARPRPTSMAFLGGWFGGIGVVTAAFVALAEVVDGDGSSPTWMSWVRVTAGGALVVYGVAKWTARKSSDELPAWLRSIQDATPRTAVRLALLLSVANPKVVLLAAAGGLDIGAADLAGGGDVVAVVAFTAVASVTVAVPVLLYAVRGDAVLPPLERAKDWLLRHNAAVLAIVVVAIGLVLVKNGVAGL